MKKEFPYDPLQTPPKATDRYNPPETELLALMEAGPLEPRESQEEQAALREMVLDSLDILNLEEMWLVNAILFERMSLRQIARSIGIPKTTVARYRDKVLAKLRDALVDHPAIQDYLSG
jgi:RNA polymerase sigma factor (sigma-70 family)|tara:strand:+ start:89 stop:445 length:357 start_codon:yes stop_codon:yes gene_type:complete